MSKDESKDDYFNPSRRRDLVRDFVVSYINRSLTVDLSMKKTGEGAEDVRTVPAETFATLKPIQVWSASLYSTYSSGAPAVYHLVYRDERFKELEELVDKYSGRVEAPETEKPVLEQKLYSLVVLLMREGRIKGSIQLQPARDAEVNNLASKLERIGKLIDNLEKRTRRLENVAERSRIPP